MMNSSTAALPKLPAPIVEDEETLVSDKASKLAERVC
jgi:hypothetical protein